MLNEKGERELCYVAEITNIAAIEGADNIELVTINDGWVCIAKIGEFKVGDLCVYFEVDSKLDEDNPVFDFMAAKHHKVKIMKLGKFKVLSQGLAMPFSAFGWEQNKYEKGTFLTKTLKVTYSVDEDNNRKANVDKYQSMISRNKKRFSKNPYRWLLKRDWGKKLLFIFYGKKKDNKKAFPTKFPFIHKSDEERIENMTFILKDKTPFIKTTKIDGTSTLFILERKAFNKKEFYVCSRNIRQLNSKQETYHSTNVYWEVENKFHIKKFLEDQLALHPAWSYVALQGETAGVSEIDGSKIQGDPHHFGELRFFGYNFIDSVTGRWNSCYAKSLAAQYGIEWVPIVDKEYILPDDLEEFKLSADGECEAYGASGLREGYVYRSTKDPNISFKNVSRKYMLKHSE